MKWVLVVVAVLVLLVVVLMLVGASLPREHRATCRATFHAGAETIFGILTDIDGQPAWRAGLKSIRHMEPIDGKPSYVEESQHGPIRYVVESSDAPHKRVLRIADESLPYGGTWTFELSPSGTGTTLSITEDGFVKPALFRVLARFVFGYHANLEQYLSSLAQKLGESVTIERVE